MVEAEPVLTIGITTYERPVSLDRALSSIMSQSGIKSGDIEVVVVDDASVSAEFKESWERLEASRATMPHPVRLLRHAVGSGGASQGRNDVIDAARGRYVFFLDDDNLIAEGSLQGLVEYLRSANMDWVSVRRSRGGRSFFLSPAARHENVPRINTLWTYLAAGPFDVQALRSHDIRFDPAVNRGEDAEFVLSVVVALSKFAALSDIDYLIEADPQPSEAKHISQGIRGAEFVYVLVAHYQRMARIIANSDLSTTEKVELQKSILRRALYSYRLADKINALSDRDVAQEALSDWAETLSQTLSFDRVEEWPGLGSEANVLRAVSTANLSGLQQAINSRAG